MNTCPNCGAELKTVPAGTSKRTGKPYKAFMACSDRNCDYTAPLGSPEGQTNIPVIEEKNTGQQVIMDELNNINERLDKLIAFVVKNLPEK